MFVSGDQYDQIAAQPICVDFEFYDTGATEVTIFTGVALISTNTVVSIGSEGWKKLDLI